METRRTIAAAVKNHFHRTCEMWRQEIANIPELEWRRGEVDYLIPARHLCHVVVTADFYTGDTPADRYDWNRLFDGDWEGMSPEQLPDKDTALQALDRMREHVGAHLRALDDEALCAAETLAPWTGPTVMHKTLYWLRHFQHHLGEMHAELRRRGIPRAPWQ